MKQTTFILLATLIVAGGCIKSNPQEGTTPVQNPLSVSSTVVAKGQPVTVTLPSDAPAAVNWSVTPSANAQVTSAKGGALLLFGQAGTYFVRAAYVLNAVDSVADTTHITVNDSVYVPPFISGYDTVSMNGHGLAITPHVNDSTQILDFFIKTTDTFSCYPTLMYTVTTGAGWMGGINMDFSSVVDGSTTVCNTSNYADAYIFPDNFNLPADGTYPLTIQVGSTVYTGSITVTDASYTINWTYTSGVTISPTSVAR